MGTGHTVDANTVALWRFDETSHQTFTTAADETGNYDATNATESTKPFITGGPNGLDDYARWYNGSSDSRRLVGTTDAALEAVLVAAWTVEAWVYVESFAANMHVIAVEGSGENPATNYLLRLSIQTTGKLATFWEYGSGTNVSVIQVAGGTVPLRTWTYVALTAFVDGGGNRVVNFFIDSGTSQDSGSGINASTDSTPRNIDLGHTGNGTESFNGAIARIRLSKVVRSTEELNNNATDSTFQFSNDANTMALWDFQEAPEIKDISGNGYHLSPFNAGANQPIITDSLIWDEGRSRLSLNTNEYYLLLQQEGMRQVFLSDWTLEWWGQFRGTGLTRGIMEWGGSGESIATDFLCQLSFRVSGGNYTLRLLWETGGASGANNVIALGSTTIVSDNVEGVTNAQQRHHYAVVVKNIGGSDRNVLVYRDGSLVETITTSSGDPTAPGYPALREPDPASGTDSSSTDFGLRVLRADGSPLWEGIVDDMRLSNIARTGPEIVASYNAGVAVGGGGTIARQNPLLVRSSP